MITKLGIPASHIVEVKNPYQAKEIVDNLPDPQNTALIFAVSQKDMQGEDTRFKFGTKKNGDPSYMQPLPENLKQLQPLTKHAYVDVTPTVNFKVQGVDADSASQIRKLYSDSNEAGRDSIIADLYGVAYPELRDTFDKRLGLNEKIQGVIYGKERIDAGDQPVSVMREHRKKLTTILENVTLMERRVREAHEPLHEDLASNSDYLEEKNRL